MTGMSTIHRPSRVVLAIGLAAMILGLVDPLEGSIVILAGIGLATVAAYRLHSSHRLALSAGLALAAAGVAALWVLSAMGGFGGNTGRSTWLGLTLVPYPVGWVIALVAAIRAWRETSSARTTPAASAGGS